MTNTAVVAHEIDSSGGMGVIAVTLGWRGVVVNGAETEMEAQGLDR